MRIASGGRHATALQGASTVVNRNGYVGFCALSEKASDRSGQPPIRDTAALAGEARPGWAGRIEEVAGADWPPQRLSV
jgi:hypothetical protein